MKLGQAGEEPTIVEASPIDVLILALYVLWVVVTVFPRSKFVEIRGAVSEAGVLDVLMMDLLWEFESWM